ncbi:tetratricopeptide repeat protein [Streptomyces sp. NPDC020096]
MTLCDHPGCAGRLMATGFCDTCRRRPPRSAEPARRPAPDGRAAESASRPTGDYGTVLDRDGLLELPTVSPPAPADLIIRDPRPPTHGRRCGADNCTELIGIGYGGQPARSRGFCPKCGTPYSFVPELRPGDRVDHYQVIGCLARGGLGWIYLAEDTRLKGLRVVLKGLINTRDEFSHRSAAEERRSLATLHHPDIVSVITDVQHLAPGAREPTGYIVMEYIGGRSLQQLLESPDLEGIFGGPLLFDHVITYGCKILGALEYLHGRKLLYCDMKPANVIHYDKEIKVIDLGAVRRVDDHDSVLVYTEKFAPPKAERDRGDFDVDTDLYTVARTLEHLARHAVPATGLADRSFRLVIDRAKHQDRAARFGSAAEMSRQLWEVLRENRALARHEQYPERSTLFAPTAVLFGSRLGAIPPLSHWTGRTGGQPLRLDIDPPDPVEAARGLPIPIPRPDDPAAPLLTSLAADNPERIEERETEDLGFQTVEVALWLCRAYLQRGEPGQADHWLREATRRMGPGAAGYDWRLAWHRGVLHLGRRDVSGAQEEFGAVHATVPGEYAPKLALGYCAEWRRKDESGADAKSYYEAVWQRDRSQGSAAFGLARIHLRHGDRAGAVGILDQVPKTSRHYDAARIAAVRVYAGRLADRAPTVDHLREVVERLPELDLDGGEAGGESRERLLAEIRETVFASRPAAGWGARFPGGRLFGPDGTERQLRELLEESFWKLAGQARTADERAELIDQAHGIRPMSTF